MPVIGSSEFTLSTFRILAGLGEGGMARVFLAVSKKQAGFEKLLVLKVMRHDLGNDPEFHSMFMQEAKIAARLNHPNVVQTYEVGEDSGRVFIAMEYLEGQAFNQIIKQVGRVNFPLDAGVRILSDALLGLHYAHELTTFDGSPLGLVHRDISPQNIFVLYTGDTKLVDFGIAKVAGATSHTRTGVIKGKLGYMAPEQIEGKQLDRRADLFSVAVILWELITKQRLVKLGDEEMAALNRRITGQDPPARSLADANVPEELLAICERGMAHKREDRYETAMEFHQALEGYLSKTQNADRKQVAKLLDKYFEKERGKVRRLIELQLASDSKAVPIDILTERPLVSPLSSVSRIALDDSSSISIEEERSEPPSQKWKLVAAGAGGAALIALGGTVLFRGQPTPPVQSPSTTASAPAEVTTTATPSISRTTPEPTPSASTSASTGKLVVPGPLRPTATATVVAPQPGQQTLPTPKRPKHGIDDSDPYQ